MLEYPPEFDYGKPMVAFIGPMCSGKTTAAMELFEEGKFEKMSLAGPLKETAKQFFGVTGKTNDERKILQELADDIKKWDRDVFPKLLLWEIFNRWEDDGEDFGPIFPIVIDDVRFTHEANDLKRYGFTLVRVYVPEELRLARIAEKYPDTDPSRFEHRSEKDWKNIKPDYTISGDGDDGLNNLRESLSFHYAQAN